VHRLQAEPATHQSDHLFIVHNMKMQNRLLPEATLALAAFAVWVGTLPSARAKTPVNRIVASIPVGTVPWGVVVSADSSTVYVANDGIPGTVSVIDAATNTVKFVISTDDNPTGLAISPDGSTLYALCHLGVTVDVISTVTNTVTSKINVFPDNPSEGTGSITLSPDGSQLYYPVGNSTFVIDTRTRSVSTISLGADLLLATQVVFTANGAKAYVVGYGGSHRVVLSLIDTASQSLVSTQKIGGVTSPGIAINPAPGRLYVSSSAREDGATVCKITTVHTVTDQVHSSSVLQAFANTNALALTTDGKYLYVIGFPKNGIEKVYTLHTATGEQVCDPFTVPGGSSWPMAMAPNGKHGYISCSFGNTTNGVVTVVDVQEK
jgi:YVTN family beta-propeller protein